MKAERLTWSSVLLLGFPLPAIATGVFLAKANGIDPQVFLPNALALALGIPLAIFLGTRNFERFDRWLPVLAILAVSLLGGTLFFEGLDGVKRWLKLGSMNLNISQVVSPLILYAAAQQPAKFAVFPAIVALGLHVLQPDAGQATSLATALIVLYLVSKPLLLLYRLLIPSASLALAIHAWRAYDPLDGLAHVEEILHLAPRIGVGVTFLTGLSILILFYPIGRRIHERKELSIALLVYWLTTFIVTEFGNFPVPVMGAGAASVLGWYISYGLVSLRAPARLTPSSLLN